MFQGPGAARLSDESILVRVEADGHKLALQVDDLVGQQQVVIKSLEANYKRVAGISGATILGDGRVALILDIAEIVRLATRRSEEHTSELQSLMRISYAVFCLQKKKIHKHNSHYTFNYKST